MQCDAQRDVCAAGIELCSVVFNERCVCAACTVQGVSIAVRCMHTCTGGGVSRAEQ